MNTVHWHITFQMEFRHSYTSIVQKQANLIVLSAQAEARTWLKWNICRSSSSYRNMQSDNKMTFFKWETVSDSWATVIQCPTSRVSVLSAESLSTILTGTSRANFWYTWMRSYNPKISSLDETNQTNQNKDRERVFPLMFSSKRIIWSTPAARMSNMTGDLTFWDTPLSRRVSSGIVHWQRKNDLESPEPPPSAPGLCCLLRK